MPADSRRTALYRFYAADGAPLYFGIALDPERRWSAHRRTEWWPAVDHNRTLIDWYASRDLASAAEAAAIAAERPRFNRAHAVLGPDTVSVAQARANLADVLAQVRILRRCAFVAKRGVEVVAFVPPELGELVRRVGGADTAAAIIADRLGVQIDGDEVIEPSGHRY